MNYFRNYLLVLFFLFSGCSSIPSIDDYFSPLIGTSIDKRIETRKQSLENPNSYYKIMNPEWADKQLPMGNGFFEYISWEGRNCVVHLKFNKSRIIVDYLAEGKGCKSRKTLWSD